MRDVTTVMGTHRTLTYALSFGFPFLTTVMITLTYLHPLLFSPPPFSHRHDGPWVINQITPLTPSFLLFPHPRFSTVMGKSKSINTHKTKQKTPLHHRPSPPPQPHKHTTNHPPCLPPNPPHSQQSPHPPLNHQHTTNPHTCNRAPGDGLPRRDGAGVDAGGAGGPPGVPPQGVQAPRARRAGACILYYNI